MKLLREHPHLFEVNARIWLSRLSAREGRDLSLSTIPQVDLEAIAERFDLLWLMGAWRRSPGARERALVTPENIGAYDRALPGWTAADVEGSPYAVYRYELDPLLGGPTELRVFRERLHNVGMRLIVDFVSNHLALDHPWTLEHPHFLVHGTEEMVRRRSGQFFPAAGGDWLAHGRDPNFPPWSDTVQVNLSSPQARDALIGQVSSIADVADGVRCDTAMLGLSDVFEQVWGWALPPGLRPPQEFWSDLIGRVNAAHPDFLFIAEAYWGLGKRLIELGFDYAYDKQLYDFLRGGSAIDIRQHLATSGPLLYRAVRFIENQDEFRATVAFGRARAHTAAIAAMTLPGLRLVHDGQIEGKRIRLPLQLVREPLETVDTSMVDFYNRLLALGNAPAFHKGTWRLLDVGPAVVWDESYRHIVGWSWTHKSSHYLVALNQSDTPAYGRLCQPRNVSWPAAAWTDLIEPVRAARVEGCGAGVNVRLGPWSARLISGEAGPEALS